MTFLYDSIQNEKPLNKSQVSKYDISAIRMNNENNSDTTMTAANTTKEVDVPDSLIPEEFKVVVNHGVAPLKIDKKY